MKTHIAWHNLAHRKARTFIILGGITFSITLMFLQLGLHNACERNATMIYDMFDFDAILVSPFYVLLVEPGTVPMGQISRVKSVAGVEKVVPLYVGKAFWKNAEVGSEYEMLVLGINCADRPFLDNGINRQLDRLTILDTALIDRKTNAQYGPRAVGSLVEIEGRRIKIAGEYDHGAGFISNGAVIISHVTFLQLFNNVSFSAAHVGLVRFSSNADPGAALSRIRSILPADVLVLSRAELEEKERFFFMKVMPVGIMFTSGVVISFLVGFFILYQILLAEVVKNAKEFATLRAIGYTARDLQLTVLEEAFLLISLAFVPALMISWVLYHFLHDSINIPVTMTAGRVLAVFALSYIMCALSGLLALRKVNAADPAELF